MFSLFLVLFVFVVMGSWTPHSSYGEGSGWYCQKCGYSERNQGGPPKNCSNCGSSDTAKC